jgi:hypothetical protein
MRISGQKGKITRPAAAIVSLRDFTYASGQPAMFAVIAAGAPEFTGVSVPSEAGLISTMSREITLD